MVNVDIFCYLNVIITSGTTKFEKKTKKFLHPLIPKMAVFAEKSQKNYNFSTLGKTPKLVLINTQKLAVHDF